MSLEVESRGSALSDDGLPVEELVVNVGPSHPSTHGVGRFVVHLDGDVVVKVDPLIGYLHRGIEKMAENRTYVQVVPLTDRLDYVGSMYANWAYCRAVERLAGITAPERAEYLRTIVCELQRIASHMMGIGSAAADTGAFTMFIYAFDVRERIVEFFEALCGNRLTYNYVRPGGVYMDAPEGWLGDVLSFARSLPKDLDEMDKLFFGNTITRSRLKDIGVLSAEDAVACGASGPVARASGVNLDIRKHEPYSVYPRMEFDIVLGDKGDAYDRNRVRLLECYESAKIIEQAVAQIPGGLVKTDGLLRLITPPPGEAYDQIESARGTLGVFVASDGGPRPYRMHVRSPAFCNLALLPMLAVGHTLPDLVVVLGSLDPVFGEVDR